MYSPLQTMTPTSNAKWCYFSRVFGFGVHTPLVDILVYMMVALVFIV